MTQRTHTTLAGQVIEYDPSPKVAAFLRRLAEMVDDPKVDEQQMIGLAYSRENPMLDQTMHPTRGFVTKEVFADPAYDVMTDLLFRKRVAQDGVDVEKIAARYSMTVAEAATELGINESAVRQAIAAKRLASWLKGGKHFLDPKQLKTFEVGTRGPKAKPKAEGAAPVAGTPKHEQADVIARFDTGANARLHVFETKLDVVMGHEKGASLKVRAAEPVAGVERIAGNRLHGHIPSWKRLVVMTTAEGGSRRAFVLEPSSEENEIAHGPFHVRGRFKIAEKANAAKRAEELWKTAEVS